MNLTSDVLKEHYGHLVVDVKIQNKTVREVLISSDSREPLLYAITIFYNLRNPIFVKIWKEIKNNLLVGETIKSKGYTISKTNGSFCKAKCPNWLLNFLGSNRQFYNVITYDLMIQISKNNILKFARIIEIIIVDQLIKTIKCQVVNNIDPEELTSLFRNNYQEANILKEIIEFC